MAPAARGVEERLEWLEDEVRSLRRALRGVERHLGPEAGEAGEVAASAAAAAASEPPAAGEPGRHAGREALADLTLVGRTLMVLGGAFLLRAVTDAGTVAVGAGVALGLLYALVWLALAHRAARPAAQPSHSPVYHALAFALIAFPLVVEAVLRFAVLPPAGGAAVLALLAALGLAVAAHRRLRSAAWFVSLGTAGSAWVLMVASGPVAAYLAVLLALGLATLALSYRRPWRALPWLTAAAVDLALLVPLIQLLFDRWPAPAGRVPVLQLAVLVGYLLAFLPRSLKPGWRPRPFEVAQTAALLAVAYGGALRAAVAAPSLARPVGFAGLLLATAAFAIAGVCLADRKHRRSALLYHAAVGSPLLLGATALLLSGPVESLLWVALAVVVCLAAVRLESVTLALLGTLFAVAAAVASGLLVHAVEALALPADRPWPDLTPAALAVLAAAALAATLPYPRRSEFWRGGAALPRLVLLVVVVLGVAGATLATLAPPLAGVAGTESVDAGVLAALRTAVLAVLAVAAAWAGRWDRLRQAAWFVYPLLALGAVKLVVQDLLVGRPATLFAALALYGAALIAAPRVMRRQASPE